MIYLWLGFRNTKLPQVEWGNGVRGIALSMVISANVCAQIVP